MLLSLKPKENKFFDLLEQSSAMAEKGAIVLQSLMHDHQLISVKLVEITEAEHAGDNITATIIDELNRSFITPIDREDIYVLCQQLDDILDGIHGTIERMHLYQTGKPSADFVKLVDVLVHSSTYLKEVTKKMRNFRKQQQEIVDLCRKIKQCETEGDALYRRGMASLFNEINDPIELIKWKEIWEHVEDAIDHCERVGKLIKGVAMKNA